MELRSVIIDDEEKSRQNLKNLLRAHCTDMNVIGESCSAKDGAELIQAMQPDLVFLDIEMPGGSGFDLLQSLRGMSCFEVIFVTAYDQYGMEAVKACAIDYVLKPISVVDLKEAVLKAEQHIYPKKENKRLKELVANMERIDKDKRIALPLSDKMEFIRVKDIVRLEADGNYTHFYISGNLHLLVCKTLKEYDELLSPFGFIRTHQSHLINIYRIAAYFKKEGGYLLMEDQSTVPISKYKRAAVIQQIIK